MSLERKLRVLIDYWNRADCSELQGLGIAADNLRCVLNGIPTDQCNCELGIDCKINLCPRRLQHLLDEAEREE